MLLSFAVLAASGLRRDAEAQWRRLTWFGARRWQLVTGSVAETALVAVAGAAVGWGAGSGIGAVVAARAGAPAGAVLAHSVLAGRGFVLATQSEGEPIGTPAGPAPEGATAELRRIDSKEPEAIDLLDMAGESAAKRLVPLGVGIFVLFVLWRILRSRR